MRFLKLKSAHEAALFSAYYEYLEFIYRDFFSPLFFSMSNNMFTNNKDSTWVPKLRFQTVSISLKYK